MKTIRTLLLCLLYITAPVGMALIQGCDPSPGTPGATGPAGPPGPAGAPDTEVDDPVLYQTYCATDNGTEFFFAFATVFADGSVVGNCNYANAQVNDSGFFIGTSCIVVGWGVQWDIAEGTLTTPTGVFDAVCQ